MGFFNIYYIYVNGEKYSGEIEDIEDALIKKELLSNQLNNNIICTNCGKDGLVRYPGRVGAFKCSECSKSSIEIKSHEIYQD
jgi:DNA-directed RNA polymerase subunit RPC12/RpoP